MKKEHAPLPCCSVEGKLEAGCDEAGRGCLAGPVFAAAVILDPTRVPEDLDDSKKLSARARGKLRREIEDTALAWAVAKVDADEIDRINILQSSVKAMHLALDALKIRPEAIAVDGNYFRKYQDVEWHTYVKGDGRFANIAAASVLAKTHRDSFMEEAHARWPQYGWKSNKGYPTAEHRRAIAVYGPSPIHRMTFTLLEPPALDLDFDGPCSGDGEA